MLKYMNRRLITIVRVKVYIILKSRRNNRSRVFILGPKNYRNVGISLPRLINFGIFSSED